MEEKEKFEANKKSNAPFLRALEVLMNEKKINQAQVAELLNTKSGTFSDYKNGKKRASQEMYDRLARAFGGRLNMHYLTGESEYMMLANVPDEEINEYRLRECNPDYDVLKKAQSTNVPNNTPAAIPSSLDRSFIIEKEVGNTKTYLEKFVASLEKQIVDKDEQIKDLRNDVAQRDKTIAMQAVRIQELENAIKLYQIDDPLRRHPFPIGVADRSEQDTTRV